jgi:hypothetical protein
MPTTIAAIRLPIAAAPDDFADHRRTRAVVAIETHPRGPEGQLSMAIGIIG